MRIAYSAWGFIGNGCIDSPDGGRLTRALFIERLLNDKCEVIWLQQNRDLDSVNKPIFSKENVEYQSTDQRKTLCKIKYDEGFPDIDILFLEWRWKLPGRNIDVDKNSKVYTPDLDRQCELLNFYLQNEKVKIVIWDKDETMSQNDEIELISKRMTDKNIIIFSPAFCPPKYYFARPTLLFPCDLNAIKGTKVNENISYYIGYIGSQYDRDEQVYKYINPFSFKFPQTVIFAGNWMKYPEKAKRNTINFPCIKFLDRILPKDMGNIYHQCLTSILLCKKNYAEHGHVTQRIHEVAANGVIGIGLKEQKGIDKFILQSNIVSDAFDLTACINKLSDMSLTELQLILDEQIEKLQPFDIRNVITIFEQTLKVK